MTGAWLFGLIFLWRRGMLFFNLFQDVIVAMLAVWHDKVRTCSCFSVGLVTHAILISACVAVNHLVNIVFFRSLEDFILEELTNG